MCVCIQTLEQKEEEGSSDEEEGEKKKPEEEEAEGEEEYDEEEFEDVSDLCCDIKPVCLIKINRECKEMLFS